ncbi:MAG: hypothetical protein K2X60_12385 [Xanthobacteraceae bacterium]|nr:hypothetical protein [Xanthobacteraceae bacterium]
MPEDSPASSGSTQMEKSASRPLVMIAVVWAAAVAALALPALGGGFFDAMSTDDAMRLVEVRDLIAGQGWFDLTQHRLDPPGASMHWSRVIDAPLAALMLVLRPVTGMHGAEAITLVLWPALLFGAALLLVVAIARRMSDEDGRDAAQVATVLLAALSIPALIHFRAGAIDHHNVQIVLLLSLVLLLPAIGQSSISTCLAGLAATVSLAIGLEMLPVIAALCVAVLGLSVWCGGAITARIGVFGAALAVSSLLLAALLLPWHSLGAPVCDAFGGPVLLLIAGGGVCLMIVAGIDRHYPVRAARFAVAAIAGVIVLGVFFKLFSGCMASPYAQVPPLVTSFWLDQVVETMSVATVAQLIPQKLAGYYGFPLITLGFAFAALIRAPSSGRWQWVVAVVTLAMLIAISLWELRGAAAANIVAAPFFAVCIAHLWPSRAQRTKMLLAALVVSPATLAGLGVAAWPLIDRTAPTQAAARQVMLCQTLSGAAPLAALPPGRIMASIDQGPAILAATQHSVFAAPYHRNNNGNLAMLNTMMAAPQDARQMLRDHRVDYVVICSGSADLIDFVRLAPNGLAARLDKGETPDYLERLDLDPAHRLSVWRVRP